MRHIFSCSENQHKTARNSHRSGQQSKSRNMKTRRLLLSTSVWLGIALPTHAAEDVVDVQRFQPPIVNTVAPVQQHSWNIPDSVRSAGVNGFSAIVPSYSNKGNLIASWNPRAGSVAERPTFIIMHGGHGLSPGNFNNALWLIRTFDANVLMLDSYWSRGRNENWLTWNEFGANMRMLDAVAAARFTRAQGADPQKTYLMGDSQGGWTVLRTFTEGHSIAPEVKQLYRAGFALYPNCPSGDNWYDRLPVGAKNGREFVPPLGPYALPVVVFTGSIDQATPLSECKIDKTLKSAYAWHNYEGATHAWDSPFGGIGSRNPKDGACTKAENIHNHFPVCRSNRYTEHMYGEITALVSKLNPSVLASTSANVRANSAAPQTTAAPRPATKYGNGMSEEQVEALMREMSEQK